MQTEKEITSHWSLTGWSNTDLQGPTFNFSGEKGGGKGEEKEGETQSTQDNTHQKLSCQPNKLSSRVQGPRFTLNEHVYPPYVTRRHMLFQAWPVQDYF